MIGYSFCPLYQYPQSRKWGGRAEEEGGKREGEEKKEGGEERFLFQDSDRRTVENNYQGSHARL
jgi:hypothetical protein